MTDACPQCIFVMRLLQMEEPAPADPEEGIFCQYEGAADRRGCGYECPRCGRLWWELDCREDLSCLLTGSVCNAR